MKTMRELILIAEGRSDANGYDIQEGPGWDKPTLEHPPFLYHHSPARYREAITRNGLVLPDDAAGIFFTDSPDAQAGPNNPIDVWMVDVSGIPLERDATTDHHHTGEEWWVTYDLSQIDASRIKIK